MMKLMRVFFLSLMALTFLTGVAWADTASDRLDYFFKSVGSLTANFSQTVRDEKGDLVREAKGTFSLLRPGRFRWDYTAPNEQSIISDGQYLWIYDKELAQVTVKELGKALGSSPILLLSEPRAVKEDFIIAESYEADGLAWIELLPKVKDTDFNKILVGLNNEGVKEMQLFDQFGQHTSIRFDQVRINQPLQASRFSFVIPPGVDVIGLDRK
jgi:outer membrane lipoprotein carrier protein